VIVLTGATGTVGKALLPELLAAGHDVRCLVRDPRRLGRHRVQVQLAINDLADPHGLRHSLRGAGTVIHLAAAIRDQGGRSLEEVNALGTYRLVRAAERAGVERFLFFSALNASSFQRTRFFRSKALAEAEVLASKMKATVVAPSIIYDVDDPWITLQRRLARFPLMPISGRGSAAFQPIWARDVARCVVAALEAKPGRFELAGPHTITYEGMAQMIAASAGRERPLLHVPLRVVKATLDAMRRIAGDAVFATWEEAELLEVPMTSPSGPTGARALGVEPRPMRSVLAVS
jgi:NADH dehydrogenase